MGVDEMKEAFNKGYLAGPTDNNLQTKVNDTVEQRVMAICTSQGIERAVWLRDLIIRELLIQEEQFNRMAKVWGAPTDTLNTSNTAGYQQKSSSAVTDEPNVR